MLRDEATVCSSNGVPCLLGVLLSAVFLSRNCLWQREFLTTSPTLPQAQPTSSSWSVLVEALAPLPQGGVTQGSCQLELPQDQPKLTAVECDTCCFHSPAWHPL